MEYINLLLKTLTGVCVCLHLREKFPILHMTYKTSVIWSCLPCVTLSSSLAPVQWPLSHKPSGSLLTRDKLPSLPSTWWTQPSVQCHFRTTFLHHPALFWGTAVNCSYICVFVVFCFLMSIYLMELGAAGGLWPRVSYFWCLLAQCQAHFGTHKLYEWVIKWGENKQLWHFLLTTRECYIAEQCK